jgi:ABC-type transport system substrate-binding protein
LAVALILGATACAGAGSDETTSAQTTTSGAGVGEPVRGGTIELLALNDLATLDNSQAVSSIDYNLVAGALFEGLYQFNNAGELEARLADGMPDVSDDGLVYTFRLRQGAMFAGPDFEPREVVADDVAYGLLRALDPNTLPAPSWGGGYLFPIQGAPAFASGESETVEGVEVVDDHTLRITLSEPTTTFVFGLTIATSWPLPREAVEERGEGFADRPVGAGPFYVQEWNKGRDITVIQNPGYVDGNLPYLDAMHIDLGVDENTHVLRLESGEADASFEQFNLTPPAIRQLRGNADINIQPTVGPRIFYLALNNWGIFENKDLRLAAAHAVTRDFVAQFGDLATPWNQLMSSTSLQSDPDGTRIYPSDQDKARKYLEVAGYDGTPVRVIYDVTDPYASANSTALKQDLEGVGFTVDLQGMQSTEFFGALGDVAYDISSTYWSADYPDAQDFISTNFVCFQVDPPWGLNISRFCDEDIDTAFRATERMAFGPERDAALRAVQQSLIDEVAGVPVMEVNPPVVWGQRVGEIVSLATYAPFDWKRAWLKSGGG